MITAFSCSCCWNSNSKTYVLFPAVIGEKEVADICGRFWFVSGGQAVRNHFNSYIDSGFILTKNKRSTCIARGYFFSDYIYLFLFSYTVGLKLNYFLTVTNPSFLRNYAWNNIPLYFPHFLWLQHSAYHSFFSKCLLSLIYWFAFCSFCCA